MKNVIIFVNAIRPATFSALRKHQEKTGQVFTPVVFVEKKIKESVTERNSQHNLLGEVARIEVDFDSPTSIRQALKPYEDKIFAVTSQYENSVYELKKLVPYLPQLTMPTESSLDWATEKKLMRELMQVYDASLVPQYLESQGYSDKDIEAIEAKIDYPLIVKPSGLEGALLVTRVNDRTELRTALQATFKGIHGAYSKWIKRQSPAVLVEEFMDGDLYSVDAYVTDKGICQPTPIVKVVTGNKVGFDDFFGYVRSTLLDLTEEQIANAYKITQSACTALGLKSVTAHVELMKLGNTWKVVELGPRIGGFRHDIYSISYGINHIVNDILNRGGEALHTPTKVKQHTALFNVYAKEEGILEEIVGLDTLRKLPSFISLDQWVQVEEPAQFARNNGDPIVVVILSHKNEQQLRDDTEALEQALQFHIRTEARPKWHQKVFSH